MTDAQPSTTEQVNPVPTDPVEVPAEPKPGFTTSEFWATVLVHAISVLAIVLDLLHVNWSHGLSTVEAAVPVLALAISGLLQAAYSDHRTRLKVEHLQEQAKVRIVQIEKEISKVESVTHIMNAAAPLLPVQVAGPVQQAEQDLQKVVSAATAPVPAVCSRCGATEVTDDRQ